MKENKLIPKRRFKGFENDEAWEQHKLGEIIKTELKGKAKAEMFGSDSVYLDANYLNGGEKSYVNSPSDVEEDDVLILWDGSQAGTVYHGFKGALGSTLKAYKPKYSGGFLYQQLKKNQQLIYNSYRTPNIPHVVKTFTDEFTIYVPNIQEQLKISCFLSNLDTHITLHQCKLKKLKDLKLAYLSEMFPKEGEIYPKRRFTGFTDPWEQRKLGDVAKFSKGRGYSKNDILEQGIPIILYGSLYTDYQTIIKEVKTFVEDKGNSVYSLGNEVIVPSSGESAEDIARASAVENKGIILGGDLNIIYPNENINSIFLAILISSGERKIELAKKAQGKSVVHLYNTDLKELNIIYPSKGEQERIGTFFRYLDNFITLHQRKLEKLENIKKAYLNEMFV